MKKMLAKFFLGFVVLLLCSLSAQAAVEKYVFDSGHTYVLWHVSHFDFSNPSGKWLAEGTLMLDEVQPRNSKVNVTVHVANIITGIPELDDHLKGKLFFNVAEFPTATFVSDKVDVTSKKTAKLHGILTVRGVSHPITLDVTLNKIGLNPITNKKTVGFSASGNLKRSDFDITTLLPGVGDEVKINIEAEAYQTN